MGAQSTMARSSGAKRPRSGDAGSGLGHAHIAQIQRARILAATFDVVAEQGAGSMSVAHVVERAGVSRRTFYELFADREDCFLAAFEDALLLVGGRVLAAYSSEGEWRERTRAALMALLSFLDEERTVGRLLICESFAGGPNTLTRRTEVLGQLTRALEDRRGETAGGGSPPPLTAEGLVGGVMSLLSTRLAQPQREPLLLLTNQLMSMIVLPYLGPAAARHELERPVPSTVVDEAPGRLHSDPFKEAGTRLTYRTVRVLVAIGELSAQGIPPSNRLVGEAAEIPDQGQISKLLKRLHRIGLIDNSGLGPGLGAPNAWSLTEAGRQLTDNIQAHTEDSDQRKHFCVTTIKETW